MSRLQIRLLLPLLLLSCFDGTQSKLERSRKRRDSDDVIATNNPKPCVQRFYGYDSYVCVCNATYCDTIEALSVDDVIPGRYVVYTTSKTGSQRLTKSTGLYTVADVANVNAIYTTTSMFRQNVSGFGGSFTDATGINLSGLSTVTQHRLIESYFGHGGLEYTLGRVPIGGTDFSIRPYTYDDLQEGEDHDLENFRLQYEDLEYKIPVIKAALNASGSRKVRLVASAWSAPAWMKNNNKINGFGFLKGKYGGTYFQIWANYYIRFLQEYRSRGIEFWAVTSQNEPTDGLIPFFTFNCMGFTTSALEAFIGRNLGPTLQASEFKNVRLLAYDDSRVNVKPYMDKIMSNSKTRKYVDGIALHWYFDYLAPTSTLDLVHDLYPEKEFLMTEASFLYNKYRGPPVALGSWDRAIEYGWRIIEDMNHWVTGWIDWNLALDPEGGPNWAKFNLEGTIIVNRTSDEFYKQPIYYVLGHFSKFVPPGSRVLCTEVSDAAALDGLAAITFLTPNGNTVLVVTNRNSNPVETDICFVETIRKYKLKIPANSIQTYICKE